MKKLLLLAALAMAATPALAKEYIVKEISGDPASKKPYYFEPAKLTIQPGDTVSFVNTDSTLHNVMFMSMPKKATGMIMGPDQETKGSKWSHTFTVPGTYEFHCHPHEAFGMKGTIIVGQSSAPGDVQKMDHEMMEKHSANMPQQSVHVVLANAKSSDSASTMPQGKGKVNEVDADSHTINISHQPIAALKWPAMKMNFPVASDVDLSSVKADDTVAFTLQGDADGNYTIVNLKPAK